MCRMVVMVSPFPLYCFGGVAVVVFPLGTEILALSPKHQERQRAKLTPTRVSDQE